MREETIVAIATPPGEGAIGIIRLSGDQSVSILNSIFKPKRGRMIGPEDDKRLVYGHIYHDQQIIDEVMASAMFAPRTYTREDLVEIHCHGGVVPMTAIVRLALEKGARMAERGEFTKRAFLNGRLDLAQAESVMDMISARTVQGFDVAYAQLEGRLSGHVKQIREELLQVMAHLAVSIDYPEEDIEEITYDEVLMRFSGIQSKIEKLMSGSNTGRILREGLKTVIVGKPNVGKSSLLNALLKEARAIVTEVPGTTRDVIEELIQIKGIPIKLIDTAGIRETDDLVERIGVERSKELFNTADLVIFMLSSSEPLSLEDREIIEFLKDRQALVVINKADLETKLDLDYVMSVLEDKKMVRTSLLMDNGIEEVEESIYELVFSGNVKSSESPLVSNIRHSDALRRAYQSISDALRVTQEYMPYDFIEVDVRNTYEFLGEITGETVEEDLVNQIFKNFCLGK